MTKYAFSAPLNTPGLNDRWNEDYNFFFTFDSSRGMNYGSTNYPQVATYRSVSGQGQHSNVGLTTFSTQPALADPMAGNLSLSAGAVQIDAGVPIPNISDRSGVDYGGSAPDLGARER